MKMLSRNMAPFVHAPLPSPWSPFLAVRKAGGAVRSPLAALAADDVRARPSPSANARALQAQSEAAGSAAAGATRKRARTSASGPGTRVSKPRAHKASGLAAALQKAQAKAQAKAAAAAATDSAARERLVAKLVKGAVAAVLRRVRVDAKARARAFEVACKAGSALVAKAAVAGVLAAVRRTPPSAATSTGSDAAVLTLLRCAALSTKAAKPASMQAAAHPLAAAVCSQGGCLRLHRGGRRLRHSPSQPSGALVAGWCLARGAT